jgi:hypothetical protein
MIPRRIVDLSRWYFRICGRAEPFFPTGSLLKEKKVISSTFCYLLIAIIHLDISLNGHPDTIPDREVPANLLDGNCPDSRERRSQPSPIYLVMQSQKGVMALHRDRRQVWRFSGHARER